MQFAQIERLNLLWGIIIFTVLLVWTYRRRREIIARFIQVQLFEEIISGLNTRRQIIKSILIVLVFIFSIIALARPQWGFEWQEVKRQGIDILVAIDTSKSMLTPDVKPNRLERTKLGIKDLVARLKGDRIGIMAFSGEAFLVCPLTVDYNGFMMSLDDLKIDTIPVGGTNIAEAINEAIKIYDKAKVKNKVLIIVTMGII